MSKLQKPNFIVFIGASLYKDLVQRAHLERVYPYINDAIHINRFPTYSDSIIDETLKIVKFKKYPTAIFVMSKYYDRVNQELQENDLEAIDKGDSKIYTINGSIIIVKKVDLFNRLPTPSFVSNQNIANFKVFGDKEALQKLEDELCQHAVIVKVLPTWYNIEIKDKEGEEILTSLVKKLNLKLLPIRSLRASIIKYFAEKNKTISAAESCTGGLLAAKFTSISGASAVIEGTMVTYSNRIKQKWLGVKKKTLEQFGAVSKECVSEMLDGIQKMSDSNIAIAISGIAGPTGGSEEKPIGTVYIGVKNEDKKIIKKYLFKGDRSFIQEQSARTALEMLIYSEPEFFDFFTKK